MRRIDNKEFFLSVCSTVFTLLLLIEQDAKKNITRGIKMKPLLLMVFLAMQVTGAHAAKQYRDFTDTQGRTIRGCVLAYNPKTGEVSFERDNRRTAKVPLSLFSEESQNYICSWRMRKLFTDDSFFKISAGRKKSKDKKGTRTTNKYIQRSENTHYEILFENRSSMDFKDLEVEYCIYYEQEDERQALRQGVRYGKISNLSISAKSKETVITEKVRTYKKELNTSYYYSDSDITQKGEVIGIWVRIHTKLSSGETLIREYSLPDKILESKRWEKSSTRTGLN